VKNDSKLKKIITHKYPELSKKEKKVADYIIQNLPVKFALSIKELSKNTSVSEATIVRFAKNLGFKGFLHLKSKIIKEAKLEMTPEDRFKLLTHGKNQILTVFRVAEQDVENINLTLNNIDHEQFRKFIRLIRSLNHIYTIGLGISSLMARIVAYQFNQAGIKVNACGKDEHAFIERLIHLDSRDLVLALSFPPYSKETIDSLKFCYQRNIRCLALTDKPIAPITQWCHAYLTVKSKNLFFTNSIPALSMIINALATELAFHNKNKVADSSKLVYQISKKEYL
jgi:DNA-binding MurR/RpiR family transcriptional regulator